MTLPHDAPDGLVELKPCPFCDGSQVTTAPDREFGDVTWDAICKACGARVTRDTEEAAVTAWNTRAQALTARPDREGVELDEQSLARIIDPDAWATFDRQRRELVRLGHDLETERGPWMYVERSLSKASEVLKLIAAARALSPVPAREEGVGGEPRFYLDHGMIHDRTTGKHVTTDGEPPFEDGINECLALLNALTAAPSLPCAQTHTPTPRSDGEG